MTRLTLLPGWGLGPAALQPLVAALNEQGLPTELAELPALESADPEVWLDELDARLSADCWLGGWSLGGMLAGALAARRGARCPGLVTLASTACFVARADWPSAMAADTFAAFRAGAAELGLTLMDRPPPIQPLLIGDSARAVEFSRLLRERGLMVGAIRPPTVPAGTARLRVTLSAAHTFEQLERLLAALGECQALLPPVEQ